MAPNWDDQFDFDDLDSKPAPKKVKDVKKAKIQDDDFFDLDDDNNKKSNKLPAIGKVPTQNINIDDSKSKNIKSNKKSQFNYDEIDDQVPPQPPKKVINQSKKLPKDDYYEEQFDDIEKIGPPKQSEVKKGIDNIVKGIPMASKEIITKPKKEESDEEFYESLEDVKSPKKQPPKKISIMNQPPIIKKIVTKQQIKPKTPQEEEYAEQNFDDYGQDFEEVEEKPAPAPVKKVEPAKKSQTQVVLKSKPEINNENQNKEKSDPKSRVSLVSNKIFSNKVQPPSIPKHPDRKVLNSATNEKADPKKPKGLERSDSKKSLKSNSQKKHGNTSRVSQSLKKNNESEILPNKHMGLVDKSFPETQQSINDMNPDKINRLNQKIRAMIRKFNDELNDLINKNMAYLKEKGTQQKPTNVQQKIKVLEEQIKNGNNSIEVMESELDRLQGRQGEIKQEEFQLIIEKKIEQVQESIKQTGKIITKLKYENTTAGNKLSKQQNDKKQAQQVSFLKTSLMQVKKQEEKNQSKIEKLQQMVDELNGKISDKDYELSEQIDQAKEKGVLMVKQETQKKYEDLKAKVSTLLSHKKKIETLAKSKADNICHQNDQIRISIKNTEAEINNLYGSIDQSHAQAIKLIEKAKQNPKISTLFTDNLNKLLRSIEQSQTANLYEVRTEGNRSQASNRPLKNSMYDNIEKSVPLKNSPMKQINSQSNQKTEDVTLMKPNFMKKKAEEQQKHKINQRIWKEEEERKRQQEAEAKRLEEEEKKKQQPFSLKKNRLIEKVEQKVEEIKEIPPLPPKVEEKKEQEKTSIVGPKMMKFKKDKSTDVTKNDISSVEQPSSQKLIINKQNKHEEPPKVQDQQKPMFAPKRFNLRNKLQKKQDSYMPTIDKPQQPKQQMPKIQKKQEQYKPKFNFSEQDPYKPSKNNIIDQVQNKVEQIVQQPEDKPKFSLRLRDRQKKKAEEEDTYMPTKITEKKEQIIPNKINQPEKSYQPTINIPKKQEKPIQFNLNKKENEPVKEISGSNPYAPKQNIANPYVKQPIIPKKESVIEPILSNNASKQALAVNNPYAPKDDAPKRQRQGPVKKIKIQNKAPKQKINIYDQVQDLTEPTAPVPIQQKNIQNYSPPSINKHEDLDLNAMLGIKKKQKLSDLDDLLGEVKVQKKKEKKRNDDFFNDIDL